MATSGIYQVGADGKAPAGLKVGDQVVTGGGTYTITGVDANGKYTSNLTNQNQTTRNYSGSYNTVSTPAAQSTATPAATTQKASGGSSGSRYSSNAQSQKQSSANNGVYQVGADGKAPEGLKVGDQVVTGGGTYTISGFNDDGTYQSSLTNKNQTTYNYKGLYDALNTNGSSGQMGNPYTVNANNNGLYKSGINNNGVYQVGADGKAPAGLMVGDRVVTGGGIYTIIGFNPDGSYISEKDTNDTRTTYNYDWPYDNVLGDTLNDPWNVQSMYSMLDWGGNRYDLNDPTLLSTIQARKDYFANKGQTVGIDGGSTNVYDADGNVISSYSGGSTGLLDAYFGIPHAEIYLRQAGYSSDDIDRISRSVWADTIRDTGDDILNQLVEGYKSEGLLTPSAVGNERLYNDLNAAALAMTNRIRGLNSRGESIDFGSPSTAAGAQTGYFGQLAEALLGEQQGWYHDLGLAQESYFLPGSAYGGGETLWKSAYDYAMDEMYKARLFGDTEKYTEMKDLANVIATSKGFSIYDDGSVRSSSVQQKTDAINKLLGTNYGIDDNGDWDAFLDQYGYYISRDLQNQAGTAPYSTFSNGRYIDQDTKDQRGEMRDAYYQLLGTSLAEQEPNESYYQQLSGLGSVYSSDLYKSLMGDMYSEPIAYQPATAAEIRAAAADAKYGGSSTPLPANTTASGSNGTSMNTEAATVLSDYYNIFNSDALAGDNSLASLYNTLAGTTGTAPSGTVTLPSGSVSSGLTVLPNSNAGGYSDYLQQAYNNLLLSELANLASAYQTDTANLQSAQQKIDNDYYAARNEIAGTNETQRRAWQEYAAAMGLNSGATGQAALTQSAAYQNAISDNANAQAAALQEIEMQRAILANQYNAAIISAQADNNAELAQALYNEAIRAEEALAAKEQQAFSNMLSLAGLAMDYSNAQASASQSAAELQYKYAALAADREYQNQQAAYQAQQDAWEQALAEREMELAEQKYLNSLKSAAATASNGGSSGGTGYYSAGTSDIVLPGTSVSNSDQSANTTVDRSGKYYNAAYTAGNNLVKMGTDVNKIFTAIYSNSNLTESQKDDIIARLGL